MRFIGNKKAVSFLERVIGNDSVAHAYIFSGPDQVGKRTLAELFARCLILDVPFDIEINQELTGVNAAHKSDLKILTPVVEEKGGVSKQKDISVSQVREAQQFLVAYPYLGKKKVLVVDDAHKMTVSAQNAMLKILEEPNSTSMLILITNEIDRILRTISSRCQTINFGLVADAEMEKELASADLADVQTTILSMGRPGRMIEFSSNPEIAREQYVQLQELVAAVNFSQTQRLALAEKYSKNVPETINSLRLWVWKLHSDCDKNGDVEYISRAHGIIGKINECISNLTTTNASGRLVLEKLFLSI